MLGCVKLAFWVAGERSRNLATVFYLDTECQLLASSSSGIAIELAGDSPTGSDRTLSAHDSGDVTPKAENGHAKAAANKAAKAAKAGHGSPPAVAVGAHGGDGSATPQQLPSQPSSPAKFKSKPIGTIGVPETETSIPVPQSQLQVPMYAT